MPRRVQDIVPAEKRSIRDIPLSDEKKKGEDSKKERMADKTDIEEIAIHRIHKTFSKIPVTPNSTIPSQKKRTKKRGKWLLIALGTIIVIAVIGFIASSTYSKATFTIIPKIMPISVNGTYVAQYGAIAPSLAYDIITVKGSASSTVAASDGAKVSTKSTGKVTLYNEYSTSPIRLIAGTRLMNDTKRVYRLTGSVVIPGYTKNTSGILPGSVTSDIVADVAGAEYNITKADSVSDFRIVAYADSDKYNSVYARSVGEITGGYVGVKKIVNQNTLASTSEILKSSIASSLLLEVNSAIPEGYVMFPSSYVTKFSSPQTSGDEKNAAVVSVDGTMYGIIFKKTDLSEKISQGKAISDFGKFGFISQGIEDLSFNIANIKDFAPEKKSSLVMHLKGDVRLIGNVPVNEIKNKLKGESLVSSEQIFKSYNAVIESGQGELVPPWAKIPTDPDRISITVDTD